MGDRDSEWKGTDGRNNNSRIPREGTAVTAVGLWFSSPFHKHEERVEKMGLSPLWQVSFPLPGLLCGENGGKSRSGQGEEGREGQGEETRKGQETATDPPDDEEDD